MAKKITGFFLNSKPYEALIPDSVYPDFDINNVSCDGEGLDMSTIQIVDVDEHNYEILKRACLFQAMLEEGVLDALLTKVEQIAAATPQGRIVKIWFDAMTTLNRWHLKAVMLQNAMGWSDEFVKQLWLRGEQIQKDDE